MPELPEVETTLRGIAPYLEGQKIRALSVRQPKLRFPVPPQLAENICGKSILSCQRRAKYLLLHLSTGSVIIHLGMSGSLRLFQSALPEAGKHDHLDLHLENGTTLRFHDPRRFGAWLWQEKGKVHSVFKQLGKEPLDADFTPHYLHQSLSRRTIPIKSALMDNKIVVGIGNIYANEALFRSFIHPNRPAKTLTLTECHTLIATIRAVLLRAIEVGGSTLRDFVDSHGNSGYFQQEYAVYGREGLACKRCQQTIERVLMAGRSTFFCPHCQS
ncbi:MAG: bifunctional DNA-formamidopyrimidine glycosylase/DNA-(apurinic or apyrimidinic site) lyase [Cardiobacteriaceae bacterium]|nr:bifunctional DNA-formamidopyrimidine glycosylase/DNA-(apurinic or apyrimidinic site) lyase [Cardiobacteriaceae bacterium]